MPSRLSLPISLALLLIGGVALAWFGSLGLRADAAKSDREARDAVRSKLVSLARIAPDVLASPTAPRVEAWELRNEGRRDIEASLPARDREALQEVTFLAFTRRRPAEALTVLDAITPRLTPEGAALAALRRSQILRAQGAPTRASAAAREGLALDVAAEAWDPQTTRLRAALAFHAARAGTATERAEARRTLLHDLASGRILEPTADFDPGALLGALLALGGDGTDLAPLLAASTRWQQGRKYAAEFSESGLHVMTGHDPYVVRRAGPRITLLDPVAVLRRHAELEGLEVRLADGGKDTSQITEGLAGSLAPLVLVLPEPDARGVASTSWWVLGLAVLAYLVGAGFLLWATVRRRRAARLQSDFVAAVSHEMKTPIASVRAMAEFLKDEPGLTPRARTYATNMMREMERLGGSVRDVLDVARIERAGRLHLDPQPDDPARVLQLLVEHLEPVIEARGRELVARLEPLQGGAQVLVDAEGLRSAVRNLIDNAAKFAPAGSTVELEGHAHAGGYRVEVLDRGPGIDPGQARRLFKRFVRGQAARDGAVAGVGLGLHIVQEIVLGHGGEVRAERREGGGARFVVHLPGREAA